MLFVLAGCSGAVPPPSEAPFRPLKAPIYSNAVLDVARLAGDWRQVAGFGSAAGCGPGSAVIAGQPAQLRIRYALCQSGKMVTGSGAMVAVGPGRFAVPGQPGPWWVLWADADYRTLVIGSPNGAVGFILNRGAFAADRLVAARDILDWNGYDLHRLQVY